MPNYCESKLEVTGEKTELIRFIRQAEGRDSALVFDNFVPMPKTKENTEEGGWFDWHIKHWGTKWDAQDIRCTTANDLVTYSFITAWSPPIQWLEAVAKQFPSLHFSLKYEEPGMDFRGEVQAVDGEVSDSCEDNA